MCSCHISNLTAFFFLLTTAFLSLFQLHVTVATTATGYKKKESENSISGD